MKNYLGALLILICLAGGWYSLQRRRLMQTRSRFTIGYLTGAIPSARGGMRYGYRFRVGGRPYEDADQRESYMATADGSRFLVEYDSLDPEVSMGHFTLAVPDSIQQAPAKGWARPPFAVPDSLLDPRTP